MKNTAQVSIVVVFAGLTFGAASAKEPPVELPTASIKAYLVEHHVPEIKPIPGAGMQRDFEERWLKWFQRVVIDPLAARLQANGPVRERAVRVAQKGIMQLRQSPQRDFSFTAGKMLEECTELVKAGMDEPLVYWLQSWALHENTRDFTASEALFTRAWKHPGITDMPPVLRQLMAANFEATCLDANQSTKLIRDFNAVIMQAARDALTDGTYRPEDDEILVYNMNRVVREECLKLDEIGVQQICEHRQLSDWARSLLTSSFYERKAWLARGHGYAGEVKPEGWKTFEELRQLSIEAALKAWKLHPDRPSAAASLLGIALTGGNVGVEPSVWFQRAIDAQFDFMHTYRSMLNGLLPRWGGSHEQMLAFGLACAQTQRYDTDIPYFFFEILNSIAMEAEDWRQICHDKLIAQVAVALCKQRVQDAPTPQLKEDAQALLGAYAWICGEYKTASEALEKVPSKFSRPVILALLWFRDADERRIRAESAIFAAGLEDSWVLAGQLMQEHKLDAAEKRYEAIRAQAKGVGSELAASKIASIKCERELAKGGWVALHVNPSLAGWQVQKGNWEGTPEGCLINHGIGTSAFIYHMARIGTEFQIRGEFESNGTGLGVLVGHGYGEADGREHWITCVQSGDARGSYGFILNGYNSSTVKEVFIGDPPSHSAFLITSHKGKISYAINGREMFRGIVAYSKLYPDSPLKLMPDGHVGFCHWLFQRDKDAKILKAEVRLLPADFKPETVVPKEITLDKIETGQDLLDYLEGSEWTLSSEADGPELAKMNIHSEKREFWYFKNEGEQQHFSITPIDAKSFKVRRSRSYVVKFNDDRTHFEFIDWPSKGVSHFGKLKSRPRPVSPDQVKPFDFRGTAWKRADSVIDFRSDGKWCEERAGRTWNGKWLVQSDSMAAVIREDGEVSNFTASPGGQKIKRHDNVTWEAVSSQVDDEK